MILSIFICEDDQKQREYMEKLISDYIALKDYEIEIALSTDNPIKLLNYLKAYPRPDSLYILDVDLQHDMNGIAMAKEIRELDLFGTIAFVTSHANLAYLTFRYHIEALDYIIKGSLEDMAEKIQECIDLTYFRNQSAASQKKSFQVKSTIGIQNVFLEEVMYFEAHYVPHKLILHTKNDRLEFRSTLKEVEELSPDFFRCNKSFVLNVKNVKRIRRTGKAGEAIMTSGAIVPIGAPKIALLTELVMK